MYEVGIGRNVATNKVVRLPWKNNIGAFIVGRPGSGKSHVIASLLIQYAIHGVDIIIAEYNADPDNKDSLIYRTRSIHHLFKTPYATTGREITDLINYLLTELNRRQKGEVEKSPLVVVLDEFLAFSRNEIPPQTTRIWRSGDSKSDEGELRTTQRSNTYWDMLVAIQSDLRKNNIRLILAVQDPAAQAGTSMRQVRDMFNYKLIMRLSSAGAKLCGITDVASQRIIEALPTGYIFMRDTEDRIVGVPYPINPSWIEQIPQTQKIQAVITREVIKDWSTEYAQQYLAQLMKNAEIYVVNRDLTIWPIESKEDLIEFLIVLGWTNNAILQVIKGRMQDVHMSIETIRKRRNDGNGN